MGLRVYKVKLYRVDENVIDNESKYEYVCDIFVMETPTGIIEISTYYKLTTSLQLSRSKGKSNCKYVIFGNEINDDNLASINEVNDYLSNTNTEWFRIYNDEISNSKKDSFKLIKKLFGRLK